MFEPPTSSTAFSWFELVNVEYNKSGATGAEHSSMNNFIDSRVEQTIDNDRSVGSCWLVVSGGGW